MKQLDKIVFLDIDGVMNNELYFSEYKHSGSGGKSIDPKNVARLNLLIEETGAKIVISSVWRLSYTPEEMGECLVKRGFNYGGNVIANTPSFRHEGFSVPRGVEIDWYLNKHYPSTIEDFKLDDLSPKVHYVILDDDSDMLYNQRNNFICVDGYVGLTPKNVFQAIKILGGRQ